MKINIENGLSKGELFLFDRGIPDSVAYFKIAKLDPVEASRQCGDHRYQGVFLLDPEKTRRLAKQVIIADKEIN